MNRNTCKSKSPFMLMATASTLIAGWCVISSSTAMATTIPANAYYGDTFTINGTRTSGSGLAGSPEINTTGTPVTYSGFNPNLYTFTTASNDTVNSGATGGTIQASPGGNDVTALLPIPAQQFTASVDVIPFQVKGASQDGENVGLFLSNSLVGNFFGTQNSNNPQGQMRIGVSQDPTSGNYELFVEGYGGPVNTYAASTLSNFNATGWNQIQAQFDLANNTVGVYFNSAAGGQFKPRQRLA